MIYIFIIILYFKENQRAGRGSRGSTQLKVQERGNEGLVFMPVFGKVSGTGRMSSEGKLDPGAYMVYWLA